LMVGDGQAGEASTRASLSAEGTEVLGLKHAAPTLENAFVATLRRLNGEVSTPQAYLTNPTRCGSYQCA
jgi:hypothetical protein